MQSLLCRSAGLGDSPGRQQQSHEIYPALDLNLGSDWEVNIGVSVPVFKGVEDRHVIKLVTGRRF